MPETGDLEVHLASCAECAGELAQYTGLFAMLASLRHELEDLPPGLTDSILARVVEADSHLMERLVRAVHDPRVRVTAASVGGVLIGAAAIGLIWWRAARRGVVRAA